VRVFRDSIVLGWLLLSLAACQTATPLPPIPTPLFWRVQFTPSLLWLGPTLNLCIRQQTGYALAVSELPKDELDASRAVFVLLWGAPDKDSGYTVELGSDDLVIVAHPQNPIRDLTSKQLVAIFSGKSRSWNIYQKENSSPIQVWMNGVGSEVRLIFDGVVGQSLNDPYAHLAPDPNAMRQAVAADPAAIGYLLKR
jgi:hypothetical protein